jgi:hypothetical protein
MPKLGQLLSQIRSSINSGRERCPSKAFLNGNQPDSLAAHTNLKAPNLFHFRRPVERGNAEARFRGSSLSRRELQEARRVGGRLARPRDGFWAALHAAASRHRRGRRRRARSPAGGASEVLRGLEGLQPPSRGKESTSEGGKRARALRTNRCLQVGIKRARSLRASHLPRRAVARWTR